MSAVIEPEEAIKLISISLDDGIHISWAQRVIHDQTSLKLIRENTAEFQKPHIVIKKKPICN